MRMVEGLDKRKEEKDLEGTSQQRRAASMRAQKKEVACGKKIPEWREGRREARGLLRRRRRRFQLQRARVAKTLRRETSEPTCRGRRPPPPVCTHVKPSSRRALLFPIPRPLSHICNSAIEEEVSALQ